jgi:hypothetical protein
MHSQHRPFLLHGSYVQGQLLRFLSILHSICNSFCSFVDELWQLKLTTKGVLCQGCMSSFRRFITARVSRNQNELPPVRTRTRTRTRTRSKLLLPSTCTTWILGVFRCRNRNRNRGNLRLRQRLRYSVIASLRKQAWQSRLFLINDEIA